MLRDWTVTGVVYKIDVDVFERFVDTKTFFACEHDGIAANSFEEYWIKRSAPVGSYPQYVVISTQTEECDYVN